MHRRGEDSPKKGPTYWKTTFRSRPHASNRPRTAPSRTRRRTARHKYNALCNKKLEMVGAGRFGFENIRRTRVEAKQKDLMGFG
ncbi:MAG: hypothetical protein MI923_04285 [Phycisphaerales bacterium]|nr:hypothetical protein [Phycisphaerales bacterium]